MAKYLITGGYGFIGTNLVNELRQNEDNEVIVYPEWLEGQNLSCKKDIDVIFHLAANTNTLYPNDVEMYQNNINAFLSVLRFAVGYKIKLIYASSAAVYGNESKPLNVYAHSKLICEEIANRYRKTNQIVGLRFFNVYGQNELHKGNMASMITRWSEQIKNGERPKAYKDGTAMRDHIYVKDVIKALRFAEQKENGIYDVGTGKPESFDEVLRLVQKTLHSSFEPILIDNPYIETYQTYTRAKLDWDFTPDYTLEEGIEDYLGENNE